MPFDYYTAPPQEVFDEIKEQSIKLWQTYDNTHGYATEKISRIENLENIKDNAWYIVAMFDSGNQMKLMRATTETTRDYISRAIIG